MPQASAKVALPSFVIGITGSTRCGKTTLARNLAKSLRCTVIGQDNYRLRGETLRIEKAGRSLVNWENEKVTDWSRLEAAIADAKKRTGIVVVEGYCVLYSSRVRDLLDCLAWVEIDQATCFERRAAKELGSCPTGWEKDEYFAECIWPFHCRYRSHVFGQHARLGADGASAALTGCVLELDGSRDPQVVSARLLQAVEQWMPKAVPQASLTDAGRRILGLAPEPKVQRKPKAKSQAKPKPDSAQEEAKSPDPQEELQIANKRLERIKKVEKKKDDGNELTPEEEEKLGRRAALEREIKQLEDAIAAGVT